jgi:23S rRNA (adenine2030-N6)-methyltransferase
MIGFVAGRVATARLAGQSHDGYLSVTAVFAQRLRDGPMDQKPLQMQYKHTFHAGNFADVHKHITLLQLIQALQKKAKGFLYLDTHAGEGLYDLAGPDARHSAESEPGIVRLERALLDATGESHGAITRYIAAVDRIRRAHGNKRSLYPGSPLLAASVLRDVDQEICVDSQAQTARALQRTFEQSAALLQVSPRVSNGDGYSELKAHLPPALRRGLALIDPPYESADEEQRIATALTDSLERFETGVFALWYPIKKQHDCDLWLARILRGVSRPAIAIEFCLRAPDNTAGLNGSGMLLINPPWQFDVEAAAWQGELEGLLGATGGSQVKGLINE